MNLDTYLLSIIVSFQKNLFELCCLPRPINLLQLNKATLKLEGKQARKQNRVDYGGMGVTLGDPSQIPSSSAGPEG